MVCYHDMIVILYLAWSAFIPTATLLCRRSWTHLNFSWGRCNDRWSRRETTEMGWKGSWPASLHSFHREVPHLSVWIKTLLVRLIREISKTVLGFVLLFLLRIMFKQTWSVLSKCYWKCAYYTVVCLFVYVFVSLQFKLFYTYFVFFRVPY